MASRVSRFANGDGSVRPVEVHRRCPRLGPAPPCGGPKTAERCQSSGFDSLPSTMHDASERAHFRFTESNRAMANDTLNLFLSWYQKPLGRFIGPAILAVIGRSSPRRVRLRASTRLGAQSGRPHTATARRLHALASEGQRPQLVTADKTRTNPTDYPLLDLGAPRGDYLIARVLPRRLRCPRACRSETPGNPSPCRLPGGRERSSSRLSLRY